MTHRKVREGDLKGKTIAKVDCKAINFLRLEFTDGSVLALEADLLSSITGVPGIFACDECAHTVLGEGTTVDEDALRQAVDVWIASPIREPMNGRDLYLDITARAAQLSYSEVIRMHGEGDVGLVAARKAVKKYLFYRLMNDPPSFLSWVPTPDSPAPALV